MYQAIPPPPLVMRAAYLSMAVVGRFSSTHLRSSSWRQEEECNGIARHSLQNYTLQLTAWLATGGGSEVDPGLRSERIFTESAIRHRCALIREHCMYSSDKRPSENVYKGHFTMSPIAIIHFQTRTTSLQWTKCALHSEVPPFKPHPLLSYQSSCCCLAQRRPPPRHCLPRGSRQSGCGWMTAARSPSPPAG